MQLLIRDGGGRTVAVDAAPDTTVAALCAAFTMRTWGVEAPQHVVLLRNGRPLDPAATAAACGLAPGAALAAAAGRLRGGGGDGGSTGAESRSAYLEMYAERKPDRVDPIELARTRATRCALSGEPLAPPCVADELGSLYNKEAVVAALLGRALPPALAHVTGLKALIDLRLEPVPRAAGGSGNGGGGGDGKAGPGPGSGSGGKAATSASASAASAALFQCPVTGAEMNGRTPFVVHRPSGWVLSERALRDARAAAEELLLGGAAGSGSSGGGSSGPIEAADLLPVNPQGEELERRREAVAAALAAERAKKAAKKHAKSSKHAGAAAAGGAAGEGGGAAGGADGAAAAVAGGSHKRGLPPPAPTANGAPPAAAAAAAAAAGLQPPAASNKRLKVPEGATPEVYKSLFRSAADERPETYCCRAVSGRYLG